MKRLIAFLCAGALAMGCAGCGNTDAAQADSQTTEKTPEVKPLESQEEIEEDEVADEQVDEEVADTSVDIDLTTMSATFVYSEVYNMLMSPTDYIGKTIKMEGVCNMYQDPETGKKYYACIVQDATQCCSQGLEFVLNEEEYSEEDYPSVGDDVTIEGEFATYMEGEYQYITMLNSEIVQ